MRRLERQLCEAIRRASHGQRGRVPAAGRELLSVFGSLSAARSWHANGPNPIAFAEIQAWCALMRVPLPAAHVAIIRAMDQAWTEEFYKIRDAGNGDQKTLPPISKAPLTAALFDVAAG